MTPLNEEKRKLRPKDKPQRGGPSDPVPYIVTALGTAYWADSVIMLQNLVGDATVNLIVTSPPFGLVRKKAYGSVDADKYVDWFRLFAEEFRRVLRPHGSLVIDIGGAWQPGLPAKSLYQYELLLTLCNEFDFYLAQEFFWWNPSRLPTPAEWVTVRRIRVKDAVNTVWWLSPTPWPKASNRRVLQPYSDSMRQLLEKGYRAKLRPSGHDISTKFSRDNRASIPPNLLAVPNTESNSRYLRYCEENDVPPNPARFPAVIPEYFIRMLTDPGDLIIDPFAGSCVTGEVAERLGRRWMCGEIEEIYLHGAEGRFIEPSNNNNNARAESAEAYYRIPRPGLLWDTAGNHNPLAEDGGQTRVIGGNDT